MKNTIVLNTGVGYIGISEEDGYITEVSFIKDSRDIRSGFKTAVLENAEKQILEYLRGSRKKFRLPLKMCGTDFQKSVWRALLKIPYGETRTYKDIAEMVGNPKASRAVGMANNKNPISIIVPCHRVIGSDGALNGYAGGIEVKEKLLRLEGAL